MMTFSTIHRWASTILFNPNCAFRTISNVLTDDELTHQLIVSLIARNALMPRLFAIEANLLITMAACNFLCSFYALDNAKAIWERTKNSLFILLDFSFKNFALESFKSLKRQGLTKLLGSDRSSTRRALHIVQTHSFCDHASHVVDKASLATRIAATIDDNSSRKRLILIAYGAFKLAKSVVIVLNLLCEFLVFRDSLVDDLLIHLSYFD